MFSRSALVLRSARSLRNHQYVARRPIIISTWQTISGVATIVIGLLPDGTKRKVGQLSTSAAAKKRPSPYRLLQPHTFLAEFAPLHVSGWRLHNLQSDSTTGSSTAIRMEEGMEDLQGRKLVRVFRFPEGKDGWRDLTKLVGTIGKVVEEEDHHPSMLISPATDYHSTGEEQTSSRGYVLELSTHTHTPMPPLRTPIPSSGAESPPSTPPPEKMRPGVTGKDTKLAERIEEAYRTLTGGVPA